MSRQPALLIPAHIVYHIYSFLKPHKNYLQAQYDDDWKKDLLTCSFVSKTWRNLALHCLFSSYALRFEGCDPCFENNTTCDDTHSPITLQRFRRFLRSSPTISKHMQHLALTMTDPEWSFDDFLDPTAVRFFLALKLLPALRTLRLHDVCLNAIFETTPELFEQITAVPLERLYISYSGFRRSVRPSHVLHLLSCFSVVSELHLEGFQIDMTIPDEMPLEPSHLRVSSLTIANVDDIIGLLDAFVPASVADCLESLYVAGLTVYGALALNRFLHKVRGLEKLTLNMDSLQSDFSRPTELLIELSSCRKIRTLTFEMSLREGIYVHDNPCNRSLVLCMAKALDSLGGIAPLTIELDFYAGVLLSEVFKKDLKRKGKEHQSHKCKICGRKRKSQEEKASRKREQEKENPDERAKQGCGLENEKKKREREDTDVERAAKRLRESTNGEIEGKGGREQEQEQKKDGYEVLTTVAPDGSKVKHAPRRGSSEGKANRTSEQQGHKVVAKQKHTARPTPNEVNPLKALASAILRLAPYSLQKVCFTFYAPHDRIEGAVKDEQILAHAFRHVLAEGRIQLQFRCILVDDID